MESCQIHRRGTRRRYVSVRCGWCSSISMSTLSEWAAITRSAEKLGCTPRDVADLGAARRGRRGPSAGCDHRGACADEGARAGEPGAAAGERDLEVGVGFLRDRARRSNQEVIAYIDAHRDRFGVEPICRVLQFAPRTYYAAKARPPSARALRDEELKPRSRGSTRRTSASTAPTRSGRSSTVRASGWRAARRTADARLGLRGVVRGKTKRTTIAGR